MCTPRLRIDGLYEQSQKVGRGIDGQREHCQSEVTPVVTTRKKKSLPKQHGQFVIFDGQETMHGYESMCH